MQINSNMQLLDSSLSPLYFNQTSFELASEKSLLLPFFNSQRFSTIQTVFETSINAFKSIFSDQTKPLCEISLLFGSALAGLSSNPTPLVLTAAGCIQPVESRKITDLAGVIAKLSAVTKDISDVGSMRDKFCMYEKVKSALEDSKQSGDTSLTHIANAVFKTADQVQVVLNPISGTISYLEGMLAEIAADRLATLASLMQIYQAIGMLNKNIESLERTFKETDDANARVYQEYYNGLGMEKLEEDLKGLIQLERKTRAIINAAEAAKKENVDNMLSLSEWENKVIEALAKAHDKLQKTQTDDEYDKQMSEISEFEDMLEEAEGNVAKQGEKFDEHVNAKKKHEKMLIEVVDERAAVEADLKDRKDFLSSIQKTTKIVHESYQNKLKVKIQELKDLAQAKYMHLELEIQNAQARIKGKTRPKKTEL